MITTNKTKQGMSINITGKVKSKVQQYMVTRLLSRDPVTALQYIKSFNNIKDDTILSSSQRSVKNFKQRFIVSQGYDTLKDKIPGYWLAKYQDMFNCSIEHGPDQKSLGEWIGVEIECSVPFNSLDLNGGSCDCYCEGCCDDYSSCGCSHDCGDQDDDTDDGHAALITYLNKQKIKFCSVKSDGSINPEPGCFPVELTIVFKKTDRTPLMKLCKALNELGAKVNKSCGMHVHLDQRDQLDKKGALSGPRIMKRGRVLGACLGLFSKIVPASRLDNHYCKLMVSSFKGKRYCAVNMTAVLKYKTIEVRLHSATTDFIKINNWINLLLLVQDSKLTAYNNVQTLSDLCMLLDVPERLITYIEKRVLKFANKPEVQEDNTSTNLELENVLAEPVVTPPNQVMINDIQRTSVEAWNALAPGNGRWVWDAVLNRAVYVPIVSHVVTA